MCPRSTIAGAVVLLVFWPGTGTTDPQELDLKAAAHAQRCGPVRSAATISGGAVTVDRQLTYERFRACNFDPNAEYLYALTLR
jgi:hypothetical protein